MEAAEDAWTAEPELIDEVVAESREHLAVAESALLALEGQNDPGAIALAFRAIHTIKGSCGFLGIDSVCRVAHVAEGLLDKLRSGTLVFDPAAASLALRSIDVLRTSVDTIAAFGAINKPVPLTPEMSALIEDLRAFDDAGAPRVGVVAAPSPVTPSPGPTPAAAAEARDDGWTRVRTDRLDLLNEMVGELVVAQSMLEKGVRSGAAGSEDLGRTLSRAAKIVRELQSTSLALRMVPMKQTFQRLARVARDVGQRTGKAVSFVMKGEDTEIDRNMVDRIADPLVHMVRNAIDHGIEDAATRAASGKPEGGTITLSAFHVGEELLLELSDDGQGVDTARVMRKAIERGLVSASAELSREATLALLFVPGFSTREEVSEISGRGVGMDVVKRAIVACRGRIDIATTVGKGSTFTIRLPLTLAITDGIMVRVASERFILPIHAIRTSFRPERSMLSSVAGKGEFVRIRDQVIPLFRMHHLFAIDGAVEDASRALLVILEHEDGPAAYLVDEVIAQQQVVCKNLGVHVASVPGIAGGAILGDGRVGLVLDPPGLAQLARQNASWQPSSRDRDSLNTTRSLS